MDSKELEYYTITLDKTSSKLDLNVDDNTSILDYLNSSSSVDIIPKGSKINLSKPTSKKAILKEHHLEPMPLFKAFSVMIHIPIATALP